MRPLALALVFTVTACATLFGPDDYRLEVTEVEVPAELTYGERPLIRMRYNLGGCETVDEIRRDRFEGRLIIDVRGREATMPPNTGCPDILRNIPDSVKVPLLPVGEYEVWTMRLSGEPFLSTLRVLPLHD